MGYQNSCLLIFCWLANQLINLQFKLYTVQQKNTIQAMQKKNKNKFLYRHYSQVKAACSAASSSQIQTYQSENKLLSGSSARIFYMYHNIYQFSSNFAALHSRPYLARQCALHWWREEPGSVSVQWLWSVWLQTFRRCRSGVHPEAHSRLQVRPEPGQQWGGRSP